MMSRANITAVLSKDVQLQSLFMHFCLSKQLLILCINSGSMMYTHTTYPVLPTSIYLHLAVVKHRTLHLPPLQQQQLRENIAALPLWEGRETPGEAGLIACTNHRAQHRLLPPDSQEMLTLDRPRTDQRGLPLKHVLIQLC